MDARIAVDAGEPLAAEPAADARIDDAVELVGEGAQTGGRRNVRVARFNPEGGMLAEKRQLRLDFAVRYVRVKPLPVADIGGRGGLYQRRETLRSRDMQSAKAAILVRGGVERG